MLGLSRRCRVVQGQIRLTKQEHEVEFAMKMMYVLRIDPFCFISPISNFCILAIECYEL